MKYEVKDCAERLNQMERFREHNMALVHELERMKAMVRQKEERNVLDKERMDKEMEIMNRRLKDLKELLDLKETV